MFETERYILEINFINGAWKIEIMEYADENHLLKPIAVYLHGARTIPIMADGENCRKIIFSKINKGRDCTRSDVAFLRYDLVTGEVSTQTSLTGESQQELVENVLRPLEEMVRELGAEAFANGTLAPLKKVALDLAKRYKLY